jgi:hypothetical protein
MKTAFLLLCIGAGIYEVHGYLYTTTLVRAGSELQAQGMKVASERG